MSLQSGKLLAFSTELTWLQSVHTSVVFNKYADLFRMMDIAVVQNKDTPRTWVGIGKRNLHATLDI